MPELNQLRQLVAIADTGTISKAAEMVHISQPALTRSIQKLENEWNVTLFDRQKNKVTLNRAGELAVEHARRVLEEVENMTAQIQAFERSQHAISIGTCAPGPVLELFGPLKERFSGMSVIWETAAEEALLPGLLENKYQIIITRKPVERRGILCQRFCSEQLYLTIPPTHPLSGRTEGIALDDLAGETMLLIKEIGIWREVVDTKMKQTHFIIQEQSDTFSALIQASALPAFATDLTIKHSRPSDHSDSPGKRVCVPILDEEATIPFYCCVKEENKDYLPE